MNSEAHKNKMMETMVAPAKIVKVVKIEENIKIYNNFRMKEPRESPRKSGKRALHKKSSKQIRAIEIYYSKKKANGEEWLQS